MNDDECRDLDEFELRQIWALMDLQRNLALSLCTTAIIFGSLAFFANDYDNAARWLVVLAGILIACAGGCTAWWLYQTFRRTNAFQAYIVAVAGLAVALNSRSIVQMFNLDRLLW